MKNQFKITIFLFMLISSFSMSFCYLSNNWEALFNGKDLSGWKVYGTEKWYVQNEELVGESGPDNWFGYLATEEVFKDFECKVDFKQELEGNSGIFFRCSVDGTKINGWQSEIAPPGEYTGGIYESYGRGWKIKPDPKNDTFLNMPDSTKDKHLKMGEWNQMKIRVVGNRVTTWLNGHKMVDFKDENIGKAKGSIAFQIHKGGGVKMRWRNIYIKRIN